MDTSGIERGRDACRRRAWRRAYDEFAAAERSGAALEGPDLERLATAAYLIGREADYLDALERAHRVRHEEGDPLAAARAAFWIGMHHAERGELGPATGWLGRAKRVIEATGGECAETGYLMLASAFRHFAEGKPSDACAAADAAVDLAQRFGDADLLALALHLQGRALVRQGRVARGLALLDEAMVSVAADELSPIVTGLIYCSVISACRSVYAFDRARQWIDALTNWCERQPDLVAYRGQCRVHRAEVLQLRGAWRDAIEEAGQAGEPGASALDRAVAAAALYQQGEARRLLGEFAAADDAYRGASRLGLEPQPGLALLRLAQDETDAAAAAIRRALDGTTDHLRRARLLPAFVEIMLVHGDAEAATAACEELERTAAELDADFLAAAAGHVRGAVALEQGNARAASDALRAACLAWRALEAPYLTARTRELLGLACHALGDEDAAALEREAAREAYAELGATADLSRLDIATARGRVRRDGHGLTPRQREVLALIATGRTNRAIAEALCISEKTVARHVSDIFGKLGLSSRAAATAYAYEHELHRPSA